MKQALHIFQKDVRKLWPQATLVVCLFAVYAILTNNSTLANSGLVGLGCWVLCARLVHEDGLTEDSPFWITRPYNRISLLTAKILFLGIFVILPLLASGIVLEARAGADVFQNAAHLLAFDASQCLWLILPALAIGAVTNNMKTFAIAVVAVFFSSFAGARWTRPSMGPGVPFILAWAPAFLGTLCVIAIQYAARKTQWSRVILAAAVVTSAFLIPRNGVAQAPQDIQIAFDETVPPHSNRNCLKVPLKISGLAPGMALQPLGATADTTSDQAGTRLMMGTAIDQTVDGYSEDLCLPGGYTNASETVRTSLHFAVIAVSDIATLPVRPGVFAAGKYGRCEIVTPFPENTQLRCDLVEPLGGSVGAGLMYPGYMVYDDGFSHDGDLFRPDPVSHDRFGGSSFASPSGWPFDEALARSDAHFVLRTERVIGTIRRDLVYRNFPLPWNQK